MFDWFRLNKGSFRQVIVASGARVPFLASGFSSGRVLEATTVTIGFVSLERSAHGRSTTLGKRVLCGMRLVRPLFQV